MVLATLLWGATFVVVRDSLGHLDPVALVCARFGLAAALWGLIGVARRRLGPAPPSAPGAVRAALIGGLVTGPFTAGGYLFQAVGLTATSAGSSAFLTSTGSLLAAVFAWPLLGQRPPAFLTLGLLMALVGSALLGLRGDLRLGVGEAWTLFGAAVYAVQIVLVSRWAHAADPVLLTATQAAITALLLLPWAPRIVPQLATMDLAGWSRLGYLVIAGSMVSPLLQVLAQRGLPPGRIGLLFALEPVFALFFATLAGERFVARWWWGAALILAAVVVVELRAARVSATTRSATA
jgi:drug/metabolite transporter (DMT)-like permease